MAGAGQTIAVNPVAYRRDFARTLGASHAVASTEETAGLARELSRGTGADVVVLTDGVASPQTFGGAYGRLGKGGTLVATSVSDGFTDSPLILPGTIVTGYEQRVQGALYGMCSPCRDIPRLLRLYEEGKLKVDELITHRYPLDEINQGYQDQRDGKSIRGVIAHQH